ncbi:unnamed protein product, partial [Ceratitis capitata]
MEGNKSTRNNENSGGEKSKTKQLWCKMKSVGNKINAGPNNCQQTTTNVRRDDRISIITPNVPLASFFFKLLAWRLANTLPTHIYIRVWVIL